VIQFWWRSGSPFGSGSPKSEIRILRIAVFGGDLFSLSASSWLCCDAQNCAEMERYLENDQLTSPLRCAAARTSWTAFLARQSRAGTQSRDTSFTLHRPVAGTPPSPSPPSFSPCSLGGATTPDDDGTNPVDSLGQLNIHVTSADLISSGSSTASRDSTRSEPDTPIAARPRPLLTRPSSSVARPSSSVQQRYVRRPTDLPLVNASTIHHSVPVQPGTTQSSSKTVSGATTGCCRRIAQRRMRGHGDVTGPFPVGESTIVRQSGPRGSVGAPSPAVNLRLPPLPSPAEMAYLRSVSGAVAAREPRRDCSGTVPTRGGGTVPSAAESHSGGPGGPVGPLEETWSAVDPKRQQQQQQQQVQRVYGCSVAECGKLYSKSSHLKAHMRSHTGKPRFIDSVNPLKDRTLGHCNKTAWR